MISIVTIKRNQTEAVRRVPRLQRLYHKKAGPWGRTECLRLSHISMYAYAITERCWALASADMRINTNKIHHSRTRELCRPSLNALRPARVRKGKDGLVTQHAQSSSSFVRVNRTTRREREGCVPETEFSLMSDRRGIQIQTSGTRVFLPVAITFLVGGRNGEFIFITTNEWK